MVLVFQIGHIGVNQDKGKRDVVEHHEGGQAREDPSIVDRRVDPRPLGGMQLGSLWEEDISPQGKPGDRIELNLHEELEVV